MIFPSRSGRPPGFSIIESLAMLAALFVFTWICLAVAKKEGLILKGGKKEGQAAGSASPASLEPAAAKSRE